MLERDASIVAQVALKAAVDMSKDLVLDDENDQARFVVRFEFLADILFDKVAEAAKQHATPVASTRQPFAPKQPFTATQRRKPQPTSWDDDDDGGIEVLNEQAGPLPSWLISACRKAGVTQVYDNRAELSPGSRSPHFRAADGATDRNGRALAFWPPKGA